uniref:Rho-GAP domain-containing protein n=1 Tax=Syphacia muris TaxID=451379 RepID=A0A158R5D6_9BILA
MERPIPAPRTRSQRLKPPVPERSFTYSTCQKKVQEVPDVVVRTAPSAATAVNFSTDPSTSEKDDLVLSSTHAVPNTEGCHLLLEKSSVGKFSELHNKNAELVDLPSLPLLNQVQDLRECGKVINDKQDSPPPVPSRNKSLQLLSKNVAASLSDDGSGLKTCEAITGTFFDVPDVGTLANERSVAERGFNSDYMRCNVTYNGAEANSLCDKDHDLIDLKSHSIAGESYNEAERQIGGSKDAPDSSDSFLDCSVLDKPLDKGLWNPRYMGLEEYRKLVKATDDGVLDVFKEESSLRSRSQSFEDDLSFTASEIQSIKDFQQEQSVVEGHSICFSGFVHLILHKKDRGKVWGVLRDSKLSFFRSEDEDESVLLGPFDLTNTLYVGRNPKKTSEVELCIRENSMCIHLSLVTDTPLNWVFLIIQCFMPKHDILNQEEDIDAGGIVWIRQGITCPWVEGWMHVDYKQRRLLYTLDRKVEVFALDIRKLIAMKSNVMKADWCASIAGSQKGPFMLTWEGCSLYIQAYNDTITSLWAEKLCSEMKKTSNKLEDCKLTKHDVPVLVDKCINFIWGFGLHQPGLYRRNGSMIDARFLMEELKEDPANVYIPSNGEDMVNVVADVLRSFFRQLDSPLIPKNIHAQLFAISKTKDSDRLKKYHEVLINLPRVRLQTLRRLLGHLKEVAEYAESNSATIDNLASVFGPTLFTVEQDDNTNGDDYNKVVQQIVVLKDLLENYKLIFQESINETRVKNEIIKKANPPKPRAEGLLVAIHLRERDSFTFNVQSALTAEQVSEEAKNRPSFNKNDSDVQFALFEVIKSGQLERRVGWKEKMSSMVAGRWIDWDSSGDCYLIFKPDPLPFSYSFRAFAENVKIASPGTKSFSTCHLKLDISKALIVQCNKSLKEVNSWAVDDLLWFNGHEASRKPPYNYTLTFLVLKKGFKYKSKFIGYCLAFSNNTDRLFWLNTALNAQRDFQPLPSNGSPL